MNNMLSFNQISEQKQILNLAPNPFVMNIEKWYFFHTSNLHFQSL
jgi:subtilase family serine protease